MANMATTPVRGSRNLPVRAAKIKKPARNTRAAAALLASPDTDNTQSDDIATEAVQEIPVNRKRSSRAASKTARKRMRGTSGATPNSIKARDRRALEKESNLKKPLITYNGNELPYHIWLRIFEYLASPLLSPTTLVITSTDIRRQLLAFARCDRLLYEPALAALYKCPPIITQHDYTTLAKRLSQSSQITSFNYQPKIEVLHVDVDSILYRKYNGSYLDLKDVIRPLSRLTELELYHPYDMPPFRDLDVTIRWKYPEDLLDIFKRVTEHAAQSHMEPEWIRLLAWKWNARLAGENFSLDKLEAFHGYPCFAGLRKLAFTNYQLPSAAIAARKSDEALELDLQALAQLSAAAMALPSLEHLIFESSTMASGPLLVMLPKTLKHLELINCWEVIADDLAEFLESHGHFLERLTISHCQSLSLGFLPVLGSACPKLTHLRMNLLYYNHHDSYKDSDPMYDTLLKEDQVPTWPKKLQYIDFDYMRFTETAAARCFFQSLVYHAPALPDLRHLVLKAKLSVGWAERNEFRRKWESKIHEVFTRISRPPQRMWREKPVKPAPVSTLPPARPGMRRSARFTSPQSSPDLPASSGPSGVKDSAKVIAMTRELQGLLKGRGSQRPGHEADHEDNIDEEGDDHDSGFVHGLCDVVDVQIDNQKPRETQYVMDDFLDSTEESDAEWNSGDD